MRRGKIGTRKWSEIIIHRHPKNIKTKANIKDVKPGFLIKNIAGSFWCKKSTLSVIFSIEKIQKTYKQHYRRLLHCFIVERLKEFVRAIKTKYYQSPNKQRNNRLYLSLSWSFKRLSMTEVDSSLFMIPNYHDRWLGYRNMGAELYMAFFVGDCSLFFALC